MYRVDSSDELSEVPLPRVAEGVGFAVSGPTGLGKTMKRLGDVVGALAFLVLGMPLYLLVALGVKLSSPGPVHYWQYRVGQGGRQFRFYKFRSMMPNADMVLDGFLDSDSEARTQWETHQKLDKDPRVTSFGRFIRKTSLDELPQFWNVLKGEMSLVGPRPVTPAERGRYGKYWSIYCAVKPGLSGLWQVSGRSDIAYADRVQLDVTYVRHWSLQLDLKILVKTVWVVLIGYGSR